MSYSQVVNLPQCVVSALSGAVVRVKNTFIDIIANDGGSSDCQDKKLCHASTTPAKMMVHDLLNCSFFRDIEESESSEPSTPSIAVSNSPLQWCYESTPMRWKEPINVFPAFQTMQPNVQPGMTNESMPASPQPRCDSAPARLLQPTNDIAILDSPDSQQACPNSQPAPRLVMPVVYWMPVCFPVSAQVNETYADPQHQGQTAEALKAAFPALAGADTKTAQDAAAMTASEHISAKTCCDEVNGCPQQRKAAAQSDKEMLKTEDTHTRRMEANESLSDKADTRLCRLSTHLRRETNAITGCQQISWCVDARRLKGNVKQVVSPSFEIYIDGNNTNAPFKMTLHPRHVSRCKGGATFEQARGRGCVHLKCEGNFSAEVGFRVSVGSCNEKKYTRGPVFHRFSDCAVAGLPRGNNDWDLFNAIDRKTETFIITLEFTSRRQMGANAALADA